MSIRLLFYPEEYFKSKRPHIEIAIIMVFISGFIPLLPSLATYIEFRFLNPEIYQMYPSAIDSSLTQGIYQFGLNLLLWVGVSTFFLIATYIINGDLKIKKVFAITGYGFLPILIGNTVITGLLIFLPVLHPKSLSSELFLLLGIALIVTFGRIPFFVWASFIWRAGLKNIWREFPSFIAFIPMVFILLIYTGKISGIFQGGVFI